ncbi:MAG: Fe-S cluster assembly protein SufD [Melioribacteraceae bacterium]|nr:Fe-S cluster assembly protein SufD [Melioribacteraceae bacterium]WKZ70367.1 MAG: Fe-S cluster assembly protein SufD [Melioribacteraceae bacterium]
MSELNKYDAIRDWYISNFQDFESKLNGQSKTFLHDIRKDALTKLKDLHFPTIKDEEWKYTNIAPLMKENFVLPEKVEATKIDEEFIYKNSFTDFDYDRIVFINGKFSPQFSIIGELPKGAVIGSLAKAITENTEIVKKYIGKYSKVEHAFTAMNQTYSTDGLFVYLPEGKMLERPLQVFFVNGNENEKILSIPRNLVIAESGSSGKIIVNYVGVNNNSYFTNTLSEIHVDVNANLDYIKIQSEKKNAFHIDKTDIYQDKGSIFNHYSFAFGASLSRTDINSVLDNENIECHFYGIYLGKDKQHLDHHTFVDHAKPNCMSNEVYKGILDDESRGVFNGQILVRPDAQKTNAYQSNKTVLLSDKATIDTKPQLEIFANDVKCSHGATIGKLDEEAYFYIRSRGVEDKIAQSMLIHAFAADVIEAVNIEQLRDQLNHKLFETLNRIEI